MAKAGVSRNGANGGAVRNGARAKAVVVPLVAEARRKLLATEKKPNGAAAGEKTSTSSRDRRLRFAELLLSISQKISGMESLDEVLDGLVEVTTNELNAERGTLFLNDPETNEL